MENSMYVTYDYKCLSCDDTRELFVKKENKDNQLCKKCKTLLVRLPAATPTTFKFNDR